MTNFRPGYLNQGDPLGNTSLSVSLVADNTVVNQVNYGKIEITSDNTTATNRTFTLTNGEMDGKMLYLVLVSGGATKADLQSSGNCKLSAAWQPDQYDTLHLMWSSSLSLWIEVARSTN